MDATTRLWIGLAGVVLGCFLILGFFGREVYRQAPPIPDRVVTESGELLMTQDSILDGQQVWQSIGGQQVGSIWGHGAYQAPDWSADWLHREAVALLELWSDREHNVAYRELAAEKRAGLEARLVTTMRHNGYDAESGTLVIPDDRAEAMRRAAAHYLDLFGDDPALDSLRESYALHENAVPDRAHRVALTQFFFWTAWACAAERPGTSASYTNNWPHEPLIDNHPTGTNVVWSLMSIVLLLAGIGGLVWYQAFRKREEPLPPVPKSDPLDRVELTPSMRATYKFALVTIALLCAQTALGGLVSHYTVEGNAVFGIPVGDYLPYALARTWHVQLGVFWIATAFLAAGLFFAPLVSGREPRYQRFGVNLLFVALVIVVIGSLLGQALAIQQKFDLDDSFLFGHQGYEYVDLGRFWQIALFIGLLLWLGLMLRALWPALTRQDSPRNRTELANSLETAVEPGRSSRTVVLLFTASTIAIGLFYGAGLFYGSRTHLTVMEYWRWWVVHLWVEGFFEVFATAVIAFVFVRFGMIRPGSAGRAVLASTIIFLFGGIPGTFHHLYFSGTPVSVMAIGASFSALEVVPLVLIGVEARQTLAMQNRAPWMMRYRWPIAFFVGVAFWNLVGAGLFGFLINPPIALYYMQGLNTTPVHAHTALFGVYGLLSLGLVLLILRRIRADREWKNSAIKLAFWGMNGGLALMVLANLLPVGLGQAWASVEYGMWYARSAEFLQQPIFETLRWLRIIGDTVFIVGVAALCWFIIGLLTGRSYVEATAAHIETQPSGHSATSR